LAIAAADWTLVFRATAQFDGASAFPDISQAATTATARARLVARRLPMAAGGNGYWKSKGFVAEGSASLWRSGQVIYSQGDFADTLFYIKKGKVKLTTVSAQAKEAVLGLLGAGDFFGEACLAGQSARIATAVTLADSAVVRIERAAFLRMLRDDPAFSEMFVTYLLARNIRSEADLIDQLFNSSEKRLARVLLLLTFGNEDCPQSRIDNISQNTLADMIGTTRSRVSFFMNKFRRQGLIDYDDEHIEVHRSLLNALLQDTVTELTRPAEHQRNS
jgi:CRP/FNR family transcriptional regulator, cyclic AMP receptor protein